MGFECVYLNVCNIVTNRQVLDNINVGVFDVWNELYLKMDFDIPVQLSTDLSGQRNLCRCESNLFARARNHDDSSVLRLPLLCLKNVWHSAQTLRLPLTLSF